MSDAEIVITGIGMRTAVGNDAVETAASVRAGVNRFAPWPASPGDDGATWIAAAVMPDPGDLPWSDKLEDLGLSPWHELLWQAQVFDGAELRAAGDRIGLYLAVPADGRPEAGSDLLTEVRAGGIPPLKPNFLELFAADQAGGAQAVARAVAELRSGRVAVAIVCGVDSHLGSSWLHELKRAGRLKGDGPAGLIPGEAAAGVVLELRAHAEARGVPILARLGPVAVASEPVPIGPDHPIRAEALSQCLRGALAGTAAQIRRVLADLNGERWRFLEWAVAETRCCHVLPRGWQLQHPADCFGDIGAAFVPCAMGLVVRWSARGHGDPSGSLIVAVSLAGARGALTVLPPDHDARDHVRA